jgi:hypothetical protein
MDQKQRIAMQRVKVREAVGILRGVGELFGTETTASGDGYGFDEWDKAVSEFEEWVFSQSPIA